MAGGDDILPQTDQQPGSPQLTPQHLDDLLTGIGPRRRAFNRALSHGFEWTLENVRDHWLAIVNGALGVFVGVALLAPVGYTLGLTGPASAIFGAYHLACAQTPSHSFFIFGYQTCLCSRCLAIYSSILLAGVVLAFVRQRQMVRNIPWYVWVLAMVPMALDGFTQLFGLRESNLALRLFTGSLFGLATAWFLFPQIEKAATEDPTPAYAPSVVPPNPPTESHV
ncbi:MAG TPA: DUF2085 domain-containing protein [Ktedonobacterales bacterium]|jgi:uncharacterized membrane protein|nr:DUF2085 domain-containing protein [Ktedonobacterales bacterium]